MVQVGRVREREQRGQMIQTERVVEEGGIDKMLQARGQSRRRARRQIMQAEGVMVEGGMNRCCGGAGGWMEGWCGGR
jgi:alkylated DNA nucleotide flippase Atl1